MPGKFAMFLFQEFYKKVMSSADVIQASGESIVTLPEVHCLTPRLVAAKT